MTAETQPVSPSSSAPGARKRHNSLFGSVVFTLGLLGAIALALRGTSPVIALASVLAVIVLVTIFHFAFSESDFFSIIFANSVGVYACIYVLFVLSNFPRVREISLQIGFILPLVAFAAGVLGHRRQIQRLIDRTHHHVSVPIRPAVTWAGPLLIVAVVTTYLQIENWKTDSQDLALIVSMAIIAGVAWLTSKHIALFLMECGLIFRAFLSNAAKLLRPAFALLTCYFLITIIFACIYTIYDQAGPVSHFLTNGAPQKLTFPDGLYLSISTITTVGFGDITASTPLARLTISLEVLCGILLLVFGVEAMLDRNRSN